MKMKHWIILILVAISCSILVFVKNFALLPHSNLYVENPSGLIDCIETADSEKLEIINGINEVNNKNAKIKSLFCNEMDVSVQKGISIQMYGELASQKDKNFRLKINRGFRVIKEADIGSNKDIFWFWSERLDEPGLYWAFHKDANESKLKGPFNPIWIMNVINPGPIDCKDVSLSKFNGLWKVSKTKQGITGEQVVNTILINPQTKRIVGNYVSSLDGKLIASAEIKEWKNEIGNKIQIHWPEEGVTIYLDLKNIKVNQNIPSTYWIKPNYTPQINMAD